MKPFWRLQELTAYEERLLKTVLEAHRQSATRNNCSAAALQHAWHGSRSYSQALIAALATLGELHGPIVQTYELLSFNCAGRVEALLEAGQRVPGWGNSFIKGELDPLWRPVDELLYRDFPEEYARLVAVSVKLHTARIKVYPNPSAYTALTAIILGMPKEIASWLFVAGRLGAWTEMILKAK